MIKLNEVTWYSKLMWIIFALGVIPTLCFCIGVQYEQVRAMSTYYIEETSMVQVPMTHPQSKLPADSEATQFGTYYFDESASPTQRWQYSYDITADTDPVRGYMKVDGFQTQLRFTTILETQDDGTYKVTFDTYDNSVLGSNTTKKFTKGDTLFTLTRTDDKHVTVMWDKLQPNTKKAAPQAIFTKK